MGQTHATCQTHTSNDPFGSSTTMLQSHLMTRNTHDVCTQPLPVAPSWCNAAVTNGLLMSQHLCRGAEHEAHNTVAT
jgi:hypothetical protein